MKINSPLPALEARPVTRTADPREAAKPPGDRVSFDRTERAVTTSLVKEKQARAERMRVLALAVRNGTYRPDPGRIAARMLETSDLLEGVEASLDEHPGAAVTP